MSWTFFLNVTNGTDRTLVVMSGTQLKWGNWYTDGVDGRRPVEIAPNETVQAVGVRSADGTWTGMEFYVTWTDKREIGQRSYGSIDLSVDVPFWSSNKSSLTTVGAYKIGGWENLPESGHNFDRAITITVGPPPVRQDRSRDDTSDEAIKKYLRRYFAANPDVTNWRDLERRIPEVDSFYVNRYLPDDIDLFARMLARTAPQDIPREMWEGIGDPYCPDLYAKDLFVKRYFAVALFSVGTDPRAIISVPMGAQKKLSENVEITSVIRNTLTVGMSLKKSLSETSTLPDVGLQLASTLDAEFRVEDVLEVSRTVVATQAKEETFVAPTDSDMQVVPWVFCTAVLLYRETKSTLPGAPDGAIHLVAASEWAQAQLYKTYLTNKRPINGDEIVTSGPTADEDQPSNYAMTIPSHDTGFHVLTPRPTHGIATHAEPNLHFRYRLGNHAPSSSIASGQSVAQDRFPGDEAVSVQRVPPPSGAQRPLTVTW